MLLKGSLVIVVIHVSSGMTKVAPTCTRVATIKAAIYGWMSPSSSTNLVSRTLQASLQPRSNKRVLPGPFCLPPSPHGMVSKRAATAGMLLSTSVAMVASLSAR